MKIIFGSLILLLSIVISYKSCSNFGASPSKEKIKIYKNSKNFNFERETFFNIDQEAMKNMQKKTFSFKLLVDFFTPRENEKPTKNLPQLKPDINKFLEKSDFIKVIWFGHSTFLLNLDNKIILVDPVFSDSAAPVSFLVKRFQPPVLQLKELPKIDFVLISHDHYDHLDMESIKFFKNKNNLFITPLGVGSHLESWGIDSKRIIEKDWWESANFSDLSFIATPSQHFSGRGLFDRNKTQWASWVIKVKGLNLYFSGDSGYSTHFKEIGEKYGPFDVAFIENGQYNENWKEVHMMPNEAANAYFDLKAKSYFPIHWGMFVLAFHSWFEPIDEISKIAKEKNINLLTPKIGEILVIKPDIKTMEWWPPLI